jgi:copper chaperone
MKTQLRSEELTCPSCITKIEKALKGLEGVSDAKVYFNTGRIEVEHEPEKVQVEALVESVRKAGYESHVSAF